MSILNKLTRTKSAFSLEFFPPKANMPLDSVFGAIDKLSVFQPLFVSVTYGAGGSNRNRTIEVASHVRKMGLEAIAHLTCVGADSSQIGDVLEVLESEGINNVLALRGDVPEGMDKKDAFTHYQYASDLISEVKKRGGFTVGAAAYPESHFEAASLEADIETMRLKAQAGADFFVTQLCFDENAIVDYFEKLYKAGIHVPVSVGIMPILNSNQIIRMALLSACSIPARLSRLVSLYGNDADAFKEAGIAYAVSQIQRLCENGINKFHLYTMNKADEIEQIIMQSGLLNA